MCRKLFGGLLLALVVAACSKPVQAPQPAPDLLAPYRPAMEQAQNLELQLKKEAEDQQKQVDDAVNK